MSEAVNRARDIQQRAADPERSRILEASAGSGKTKVLVDRFLRLCLSGPGVDPRAILAITFTRKATVEIAARLQQQAHRLAISPPAERREALATILGREPRADELARAAWFHESLLADPTSLGVDTVHAFCQKVLGRFAAEAGLDPQVNVLDDRQEEEYRTEALDHLELELARDPERAARYASLAATAGGARGKVASFFQRRVYLQRWADRVSPPPASLAAAVGRPLAACLPGMLEDLRASMLADTPWAGATELDPTLLAPELSQALRDLAGPGLDLVEAQDADLGFTKGFITQRDDLRTTALEAAVSLDSDSSVLPEVVRTFQSLLLVEEGKKIRAFKGKKDTKEERDEAFASAVEPLLKIFGLLKLPAVLDHNAALLEQGLRAFDLYTRAKRRDRVVDFQDLEYLALRLLTDPVHGPRIHYRLDARLDHLLLDEFQDTNRNQWDLLYPLVDEALAGGTAFVVGDVKQSIYGFRGAEPAIFDDTRHLFAERVGEDSLLNLPTNFRSLPRLVETVGTVCRNEPLAGYLGKEADTAAQQAARAVAPGTVMFVEPFLPQDLDSGHDRAARAVVDLVVKILADSTGTWTWNPETRQDEGRPLEFADILILARTKTHLAAYESALQRAGLPFVPAGRGLLARSREVQDLLALLRWLIYPADDAAAATVLRSPLVRLPEAEVQALLTARRQGRRRSLREVVAGRFEVLDGWFKLAGLLPLHDLLRRVYREGEVLSRFEIARGEQARFNCLRLLDLALAAEARGGSLRDFVAELERVARIGGEEEGALPGEGSGGRIRVMTVHGSKGLEASVVILADADAQLKERSEDLLLGRPHEDGPWLHDLRRESCVGPERRSGGQVSVPLTPAHDRAVARLMTEESHILYVALTRARDRLYVLGGRGLRAPKQSLLGWLRQAQPDPEVWTTPEDLTQDREPSVPQEDSEPEILASRMKQVARRSRRWSPPVIKPRYQLAKPSQLEAEPAPHSSPSTPATSRDNEATLRGTRIHRWLEHACLLGHMPAAPDDHQDEWDEARAAFEHPDLAWVFDAQGRSEIPVLHRRGEVMMTGIIDRLVIRPDRVDIVDFKSNRAEMGDLPGLVTHYRPQLLAYREALKALYPDRPVRCWLLWTWPDLEWLTEVNP